MPRLAPILTAALLTLVPFHTTPALAVGSSDGSSAQGAAAASADYAAAKSLIDAENYAAALPILIGLTAAEADNADAWNLLGYAHRKLGNLPDAALAYTTALTLNPDHLGALEYQGELYLETGQPDLARANLERLRILCGNCEEAEDLTEALAAMGS